MRAHRGGVAVAVAVAAVAAGAATVALRPRGGLIEPAPVDATAYFSTEELERARDFRGPQRILGLGSLAVSGATLALLALRPPSGARRLLDRAASRPILGAAAAGAGLSVVLVAVTLPLDAVRHERAVDVGLATQGWAAWLGDLAKSAGVQAVLAAGGGALGLALVRRFPRNWWAPASVAVVAVSAGFVFLAPVVLDPLFNRFTPLPQGALRSQVLDLAERSGVEVGEVYRVDASRRTTGANAYVGGLGATKRVVLYDNLLEEFPPGEVRSVVAHELAHVRHRDLGRGLLWLALVAPAAMFLVQRLTEAMERRRRSSTRPAAGAGHAGPAILPGLALAVGLVALLSGVAGNALSRRVEARADAYALELTRDPAAFIALERRLSTQNVSDPDPPALLHLLFGTHPTTLDRIGFGRAWRPGAEPPAPGPG